MTPLFLAAALLATSPVSYVPGPNALEPDSKESAGSKPTAVQLDVYPPAVHLSTARDRQSVIAVLTLSDGTTRDVTAETTFKAADESFAKASVGEDGALTYHPAADGTTTLTASYDGKSVEVPLSVVDSGASPPVGFRNDVMPIFARAGCNMGSCHGAARGKDGFRMGLFGYDPVGDHFRITREQAGRRINLGVPEHSLLFEKSIGAVSHTGGKLFEADSEYARLILDWIAAGAIDDGAKENWKEGETGPPACVSLELYPPSIALTGEGSDQRMVARATYADGTDRDVTHLVAWNTSNPTAAAITPEGAVTAGAVNGTGGAEAFITARFDVHTVGVPAIVLPKNVEFEFPDVEPANYIDEAIYTKLATLRIAPSELCSDEEFVRRAYLDLVGVVPPAEATREFIENTDPSKRAALVDSLLDKPAFADIWVMKWAELLTIRTANNVLSGKEAVLYHRWLKEQVDGNVPVDEMVRELLASSGGTFDTPATNYYRTERDTLKVAENVAQVFMGMRIQCAQCHNHPFDRWTMEDYYGFAAFFAQVSTKNSDDPRERIVYNRGGGEVKHPLTNENMAPKFLGGIQPDFQADERFKGRDRREVLAKWLTSEENPYFARNIVNLVWAHFTGRGIVEPVDDVRVSNPPANEALLDALAQRFIESGYDLKGLVRDICASRTYQLATRTNPTNVGDTANFASAKLRRMRAEVLLDSINAVTESPEKFNGLPLGSRAVEIADGNTSTYFLTTFGRASRETVCSCEVRVEPNLAQALHLLNGNTVHDKVQRGKVVETLLKGVEGKDGAESVPPMEPVEVLEEITLRCLARQPTDAEKKALEEALAAGEAPQAVLEDYFWAVLNSREFLFNH
ncbi:DUF1549 and DUF1553 domain-containing protein [Alienimonas californiensis]|uniref:Bacterial Ig-like domain (Group 2) n=1 Tax=Alienimonas californiensis TaxID=2527989 RepID=A0A517P5B0_9PLAN|nr:DUF1549 and DUF1553 domain-containing protein [Alienimonas californiensis]QDT14535.1 hypothetical protein CA12_06100 [Alienimonas californiensis]